MFAIPDYKISQNLLFLYLLKKVNIQNNKIYELQYFNIIAKRILLVNTIYLCFRVPGFFPYKKYKKIINRCILVV